MNEPTSTRLLKVPEGLDAAAAVLRQGGLVAFPTETVYGLGANATDEAAVKRIFAAKGRPPDNPIIVHVSDLAQMTPLVKRYPPAAALLAERFWPGPLTLVLPRSGRVPEAVTGGLDTVAIRMPDHPVARELIRRAGVPVAAPSANLSGRPSPTRAEDVMEDLAGRIEVVLDGGPTGIGLESTVLDLTADPPAILRPGGVTWEQLRSVLGGVRPAPAAAGSDAGGSGAESGPARSPGTKYTHYAPRARVEVVAGDSTRVGPRLRELAQGYLEEGRRVALLCDPSTSRSLADLGGGTVLRRVLDGPDYTTSLAAEVYSQLREFDRQGAEVVLIEGVSTTGLGAAVMDRLRRAAAGRVWRV